MATLTIERVEWVRVPGYGAALRLRVNGRTLRFGHTHLRQYGYVHVGTGIEDIIGESVIPADPDDGRSEFRGNTFTNHPEIVRVYDEWDEAVRSGEYEPQVRFPVD